MERAVVDLRKRYSWKRRSIIRLCDLLLRPLSLCSKSKAQFDLVDVKRILVVEEGLLGDFVMLIPFLKSLRSRFPDAHLAILGRANMTDLLLHQGLADEMIRMRLPWFEKQFNSFWRRYNLFSLQWFRFVRDLFRLRRRHFDLAFAAEMSDLRHNLILWLTGARRRVGYGFAGGGSLLTDVAVPDPQRPHVSELSLRLLEHLDIPVVDNHPLLRVVSEDKEFAAQFLSGCGVRNGDLIVGIHPAAGMPTREWGGIRYQEVARQLIGGFGAKVLWFTSPGVQEPIPSGSNLVQVALPLEQFVAVLSHCQLLVCNDSGPMHVAAGLGIPVVAIFGPNYPEWVGPLGNGHQIVIRNEIPCRPCRDRCLFNEPYCLTLISVDRVVQACAKVIETLGMARASCLSKT
jgi:heptosyltransferase-2